MSFLGGAALLWLFHGQGRTAQKRSVSVYRTALEVLVEDIRASSDALAVIVPLIFAGAGIGLFVQVALLAGQNAVNHRYLGTATGALNFFKSIGGAFGAALFGAILTRGLTGGHAVAAYQTVFEWTIPFMAVALVLALVMREEPLSEEMAEIAAGKAEAPEF
ncbi:MAG: hypothetical protein ABSA93_15180 [Streptosporangiaceae bacterium]